MDESPEQKYDRLQSEIQRAILRDFPNPERQGCPGDAIVQGLANSPERIRVEDELDERSDWYHITHCSPCYAAFLEARDGARVRVRGKQQVTRRAILAGSIATLAAVSGWFVIRVNGIRHVELDLDASAAYRGENPSAQKQPRMELPNGRLEVTLKLPMGSAEGMYRVELRNPATDATVFAKSVPVSMEQGFPHLRFSLDLHANPGAYILAVRNDHREVWRYYSVAVA